MHPLDKLVAWVEGLHGAVSPEAVLLKMADLGMIRMSACPGCGVRFVVTDRRQTYCSTRCGTRARVRRFRRRKNSAPALK